VIFIFDRRWKAKIKNSIQLLALLCSVLVIPYASAEEESPETDVSEVDVHDVPVHNALETRIFASVGGFFSTRSFNVTVEGSVAPQVPRQFVDFESDFNADDSPELFVAELRWQFAEKWNLGLQYFSSTRNARAVLEETIEWDDLVFDVGADIRAGTHVDITRIVLSYNFIRKGGHDLRLAGGLHWLEMGASISGEATLGDGSTAFASNRASASLPIPNVGAVYQYSPSAKWLMTIRADWFSASVGEYSGSIWNTMASANYQVAKHIGLGAGYQFFQIDGTVDADKWRGDLKVRFDGPFLQLTGFW